MDKIFQEWSQAQWLKSVILAILEADIWKIAGQPKQKEFTRPHLNRKNCE
jgi:hypothetical protein